MSDWKTLLRDRGMQVLADPRVQDLMKDERVTKGMMKVLSLRGEAQERFEKGVEDLAKSLNLATTAEVKDLQRKLKKMEKELEKAKAEAKKPA